MTPKSKKTPAQLDREIEQWEQETKKREQKRGNQLGTLIAAFKKSPAIIIVEKGVRRALVIRSGEMQNPGEGKLRATMFAADGPHGHITRDTDRALAEELLHYYTPLSVRPASDADVVRWTSTPEFARGAKIGAYTQASNTLRWRAGKQGKQDRAREIERKADTLFATDIDGAIAVLEAGIKEMP